jgi:restriction system protein
LIPDGGVDIHLFHPNENTAAAIVQCKAWSSYKVGIKPIRELFGVMSAEGVPEAYFVTTSDYTGEAYAFAASQRMTLIHGKDLLKRIESLPETDQVNLYTMATAGDYTTPTCPSCGRKMVTREAKKGRNAGNSFWGCPGFPRCQGKLNQ